MKTLLKTTILFLFLFEVNFFYIIKNEKFNFLNSKHQKIFMVIITLFIFLLFLRKILKEKYKFNKHILFFMLLSTIEIFYSLLKYNQGLKSVAHESNYICLLFAYYIFAYYIKKYKEKDFLQIVIMRFSLVLSVILTIQWKIYDSNMFLNLQSTSFRYDDFRITDGEGIINIAIVIAFAYILKRPKKHILLSCATFLTCIIELAFVQKTRMALLIVIFSCFIIMFVKYYKRFCKLYFALCTVVILMIVFLNSTYANTVFNSFSSDDMSYIARNQEIEFYVDQIEEDLTLGTGFINPEIHDFNEALVRGPYGYFYKTDVGLIGFTNTFGLIGLIWYISLLIKLFKLILISIKNDTIKNNYEILGLFIFALLSTGTLIIMDTQRIIGMVILLSLADSLYYSINTNNLSKENIDIVDAATQ